MFVGRDEHLRWFESEPTLMKGKFVCPGKCGYLPQEMYPKLVPGNYIKMVPELVESVPGDIAERMLAKVMKDEFGFRYATRGENKDVINTGKIHCECKSVRSGRLLQWMWQAIRDCRKYKLKVPTVWVLYNKHWYVMVPAKALRALAREIL